MEDANPIDTLVYAVSNKDDNAAIGRSPKLRLPCELVSKYVLPTLRSMVAKELIEKHQFSQVRAARELGTTQAAISQYLCSKRGTKKLHELEAAVEIGRIAEQMAQEIAVNSRSSTEILAKFCDSCRSLRNSGALCELHRDLVSIPESCSLCSETHRTSFR